MVNRFCIAQPLPNDMCNVLKQKSLVDMLLSLEFAFYVFLTTLLLLITPLEETKNVMKKEMSISMCFPIIDFLTMSCNFWYQLFRLVVIFGLNINFTF